MSPLSANIEPVSDDAPRPFWSVVVPVYARQAYLEQCLASILDQGFDARDMEILVVDDASPTDLKAFVERCGRGRVRYIRHPANLGLYPSTNAALARTRGRWVHVLHDDDWVMPGFYRTMQQAVENAPANVGAACCNAAPDHDADRDPGVRLKPVILEGQGVATLTLGAFRPDAGVMPRKFIGALSIVNLLNLPAVIYRREAFERVGLFREDLPFTADWEWYVRCGVQFDWCYQPEVLARCRLHSGNQTLDLARAGRTARDIGRTLDIFAEYLPADMAERAQPDARRYHARHFLATAIRALEKGDTEGVRVFLHEALAVDPDATLRPEFTQLLRRPAAADVREQVRAALLRALG